MKGAPLSSKSSRCTRYWAPPVGCASHPTPNCSKGSDAFCDFSSLTDMRQVVAFAEYAYLVSAATVKMSCLLFYGRIFSPSRETLLFIKGGIFFVLAACAAMLFSTVFRCIPIQKSWNALSPGHCFPVKRLAYASGIINVVSDIYVLVLPIPCIWGLNLSTSRKLRTIAIFSLGILYDSSMYSD
jgi:hypothetical protein